MVNKQESNDASTEAIIRGLRKDVESLRYGTITIKVHNGKITQVEITEKRRFDVPMEFEKGGGI